MPTFPGCPELFTKFNHATEVSNENRMFDDEIACGWSRRWQGSTAQAPRLLHLGRQDPDKR